MKPKKEKTTPSSDRCPPEVPADSGPTARTPHFTGPKVNVRQSLRALRDRDAAYVITHPISRRA